MKYVYWLMHVRSHDDVDDVKTIGIFESEEKAKMAISIAETKEGFSDHKEGFHISKYELNRLYWEEGFITQ